MSLKITGHPKTEAKTEVEQKRKLDWYVPIFYIQSLKLFREASRINFLIISHPHSTESRFSSLQNEHDKWLVHTPRENGFDPQIIFLTLKCYQ